MCASLLLQEAVQCVEELELGPQLHVFVRVGVESTLERSQVTREHMGVLLLQLLQQGPLPRGQFIKGSVLTHTHIYSDLLVSSRPDEGSHVFISFFPSGLQRRWSRRMTWPSTSPTSGCTWQSCSALC